MGERSGSPWKIGKHPFLYFKTSPEAIQLDALMNVRFPILLFSVVDLPDERGIDICKRVVYLNVTPRRSATSAFVAGPLFLPPKVCFSKMLHKLLHIALLKKSIKLTKTRQYGAPRSTIKDSLSATSLIYSIKTNASVLWRQRLERGVPIQCSDLRVGAFSHEHARIEVHRSPRRWLSATSPHPEGPPGQAAT